MAERLPRCRLRTCPTRCQSYARMRIPAAPRLAASALVTILAAFAPQGAALGSTSASPMPAYPSYDCGNPLFRAHWYSVEHDAGQLARVPQARTDLVRCSMWNRIPSCCTPSMEEPQELAFDVRKDELKHNVGLLKAYLAELTDLRASDVYRHSESSERALLDRAVLSFSKTLRLAGTCARAVLTAVAGLSCFGCNPHWSNIVDRDSEGEVTAVNISGEACVRVDAACGRFGRAAQHAAATVLASTLAKRPQTALPDLSMFADRESVCSWMRSSLAMRPLPSTRPASTESGWPTLGSVTAAPGTARRLAAPVSSGWPVGPPYATRAVQALDPVRDGEQSGFDLDAAAEEVSGAAMAPSVVV
eukprot:TRINITY_DN23063_c0_g2_i2.p1 TRINITY_DN23063_c0_g2~~TRINITY_DN23063_c0_g2_i2.p1  ORF type:complete len:384 (+),score=38.43 TRINITY_DN23063_c0_g2_i2:70-1152(+)